MRQLAQNGRVNDRRDSQSRMMKRDCKDTDASCKSGATQDARLEGTVLAVTLVTIACALEYAKIF